MVKRSYARSAVMHESTIRRRKSVKVSWLSEGSRLAFEMKLNTAPAPTKGFRQALADVKPEATYVIALVDTEYPFGRDSASGSSGYVGGTHVTACGVMSSEKMLRLGRYSAICPAS